MVDFAFSEEQELFRQSVREFAQQELAPGYLQRAKSDDPSWEVIGKLRDQGLLAHRPGGPDAQGRAHPRRDPGRRGGDGLKMVMGELDYIRVMIGLQCLGAAQAIQDALLIHGHLGYSDEFPLEQRLRDVLGFQLADGTAQIQKIVVARELIGRELLPY